MAETSQDLQLQRSQARAYLDLLAPDRISAVHELLENMLSPLDRRLALAPMDDEPLTEAERNAIRAGLASLEKSRGIPMEEILAEFGVTSTEFERLPDAPIKT
jgi:hypothetical protein